MWLCYVFDGGGYVMGILGMWLCCGYLRDVVILWVFKRCGFIKGI